MMRYVDRRQAGVALAAADCRPHRHLVNRLYRHNGDPVVPTDDARCAHGGLGRAALGRERGFSSCRRERIRDATAWHAVWLLVTGGFSGPSATRATVWLLLIPISDGQPKEKVMAAEVRTFGWSTWLLVLIVVLLVLAAGLLVLAE